MSAIVARPYACHGEILASQLTPIKEKIKETIKNIGSRVSRRQDRISNYQDAPRNLPRGLYELVYTASPPCSARTQRKLLAWQRANSCGAMVPLWRARGKGRCLGCVAVRNNR